MTSLAAFDLHGVTLTVDAQPPVADAIASRLSVFRVDAVDQPDLRFTAVPTTGIALCPHGDTTRTVYDAPNGPVVYDDASDVLYLDHGRGVALHCRPGAGLAEMSGSAGDEDTWLLSHPLFSLALVELLKRRGLFSLHAGCVATDSGVGILLAGPSGAGKSTLSIGLSRQGLHFVSDDTVFLDATPAGLEVRGFPDEVDVTDETLAMFAELAPLAAHRLGASGSVPKASLPVERVFGASARLTCRPAAVLLIQVGETDASHIEPVSAGEALLELVPNVLLTEAASSQAHLDVLGELARTTPCWRLRTGRDFPLLAGLLTDLVS